MGAEVLAQIKSDAGLKTIPTVVLTTSEAEVDIARSYQLQANCYLCKPAQLEAFEALVKSVNEFWLMKAKLPPQKKSAVTETPVRNLLVIEDNAGDARLLREMLNEDGAADIEFAQVASMSDAEQYLASRTVDIILLDLGLPDVQGLDAVRRARSAAPGRCAGSDDRALTTRPWRRTPCRKGRKTI